jgi:hypothetical protein
MIYQISDQSNIILALIASEILGSDLIRSWDIIFIVDKNPMYMIIFVKYAKHIGYLLIGI